MAIATSEEYKKKKKEEERNPNNVQEATVQNQGITEDSITNIDREQQPISTPEPQRNPVLDLYDGWYQKEEADLEAENQRKQERAKKKQHLHLLGEAAKSLGDMTGAFNNAPIRKRETNPYLNKALQMPDVIDQELLDRKQRLSEIALREGSQALNAELDREHRKRQWEAAFKDRENDRKARALEADKNRAQDQNQWDKEYALKAKWNDARIAAEKKNAESLALAREAQANKNNSAASGKEANAPREWTVSGYGTIPRLTPAELEWLERRGDALYSMVGDPNVPEDIKMVIMDKGLNRDQMNFESERKIDAALIEIIKGAVDEQGNPIPPENLSEYIRNQKTFSESPGEQRVNQLDDLDL